MWQQCAAAEAIGKYCRQYFITYLNTAGSMRRQQCAGSIGRSCPQKQPAPAGGVLQWLDDEYRFLTPPKVRSRPPPGYCRAVRSAAS